MNLQQLLEKIAELSKQIINLEKERRQLVRENAIFCNNCVHFVQASSAPNVRSCNCEQNNWPCCGFQPTEAWRDSKRGV